VPRRFQNQAPIRPPALDRAPTKLTHFRPPAREILHLKLTHFRPPGITGEKSLCRDHAALILSKVEAGLTAQRIYQDLKTEHAFAGSYQSVKRYAHKLRQTDPALVHRIEVQPAEEVQVDFGTGQRCLERTERKPKPGSSAWS